MRNECATWCNGAAAKKTRTAFNGLRLHRQISLDDGVIARPLGQRTCDRFTTPGLAAAGQVHKVGQYSIRNPRNKRLAEFHIFVA